MMKRNILAVVIPALLVAGAANAAEIYNKNGNKLDFYGKMVGEHVWTTNCGEVIVSACVDHCREKHAKPYGTRIWAGQAVSARLVGK